MEYLEIDTAGLSNQPRMMPPEERFGHMSLLSVG